MKEKETAVQTEAASSEKKAKARTEENKTVKAAPTYSPRAIIDELKKVEWPSFKTLMGQSGLVICFTLIFGLYFFICELAASSLVSWIVSM